MTVQKQRPSSSSASRGHALIFWGFPLTLRLAKFSVGEATHWGLVDASGTFGCITVREKLDGLCSQGVIGPRRQKLWARERGMMVNIKCQYPKSTKMQVIKASLLFKILWLDWGEHCRRGSLSSGHACTVICGNQAPVPAVLPSLTVFHCFAARTKEERPLPTHFEHSPLHCSGCWMGPLWCPLQDQGTQSPATQDVVLTPHS